MKVKVYKKAKRNSVLQKLKEFNIQIESTSEAGVIVTKDAGYGATRACAMQLLSDGIVKHGELSFLTPVSGNMCVEKMEIHL